MKNIFISIFYVLLFSFSSAQAVDTEVKESSDINEKIDVKCHVALIDGSEAIIFQRIQQDNLVTLSKRIVGERVLTQKSIEEIKIYRAYQCILTEESFTSFKAQTLDKKTPR